MSVLLQPPPTAEELALKEQVTQMLTSQGVLAKLKAELRAAVFEVMHDREGFTKRSDPTAPKLSDYPIDTATTAVSLIVECLHFFHWENALRVLLAETDAADEQPDTVRLAMKLKLGIYGSARTPALFQLVESRIHGNNTAADSAALVSTVKHEQFDEDDNEEVEIRAVNEQEPKAKLWESEEVVYPNAFGKTELRADIENHKESKDEMNDEPNDEEGERSAEIEESMAEEVPSGSELEESNFTNYEDEESHDHSATDNTQTTSRYPQRSQAEPNVDEKHEDESSGHESNDSDAVSLAAPPPAPAKLPALPPLVNTQAGILAEDAEDDFDAEEEAERLRKLDAALQAMEAEDDTGTLQQLKASLQVELQEQDSLASSGGHGRAGDDDDDDDETSKGGDTEQGDDEGYGSSDFEEEEIASDISEEMESMPELSDKEDESEDGVALSTAKIETPHALRNDTRVDSEDALNSYDYIEDVEKGGW